MSYTDKTLKCLDCGSDFVFTASEQEFFANRGYTNEPKRCPTCREARKTRREGTDGGTGFGAARQMFSAVCTECGKEARVPFKPRDNRPVYCSDCYSKVKSSAPRI